MLLEKLKIFFVLILIFFWITAIFTFLQQQKIKSAKLTILSQNIRELK